MIRKSGWTIVIGIVAAGALATLLLTTACSGNKYGGKELIVINGEPITEGYLEFLGSVNPRIRSQLANPMGRKQIIDNIIEQKLFYQAAAKKGLDHDPQVRDKANLYRQVIVAQSYVEKQLEDDARKYYDVHKAEFEKLRLRHILIKTEPPAASSNPIAKSMTPQAPEGHSDADALELAKKVRERLDKKEDFETVAREVTEDPITKSSGGDLGDVARNEPRLSRRGYDPLVEKAFSMKVGEVSDPVKTGDGYHVIMVTRGVEVEPFESAKQGIMFKQQGEIRNRLLTDLKKQAKISYTDASLKPQEAAPLTDAGPASQGGPAVQIGPSPAQPKDPYARPTPAQ